MLISTALLLDSIIRNSVCTPAKLPCRRVEVGYEKVYTGVPELADQIETVYSLMVMKVKNVWKNIQGATAF
jgi:hypothetical protein